MNELQQVADGMTFSEIRRRLTLRERCEAQRLQRQPKKTTPPVGVPRKIPSRDYDTAADWAEHLRLGGTKHLRRNLRNVPRELIAEVVRLLKGAA